MLLTYEKVTDSQERVESFERKMLKDNARFVPQAYIRTPIENEGNAKHIFHDCRGIVIRKVRTPTEVLIQGIIPPSMVHVLREVANQGYVLEAFKQTITSEEPERIK
ncbi:MAG: hypothetical protein GTN36_04835 [Candidatus Aenigmarchaeota archaeon]|nr:hypothetical protein [Candidatus Aenigmarchaeota archaeon]